MEKRGQVTIFIIAGILIVSSIALFFLFRSGVVPGIGGKAEQNPNVFLEACIEDKIREGIELISLQGGYTENPLSIYFKFEDENLPVNISYLCYNQLPYALCMPQKPLLIQHLKNELKNYISEDIKNCFGELTENLGKQYVVEANYQGFEFELIEGKVIVKIDGEIVLTKTEETTKQEDFEIIILSRFYDLANMVQKIVNKEATTGDFSHYNLFLYSDFDINKYKTADSSVIYSVKHRESNEEFRFAVRGGVMPPGFGLKFT
ncbi:hypothetical protein KAJ87_02745 [Candidatus Pacearchaeota archaeon]|nr:hypothetical protein [Candidatus Pacearchaeota archaeon]